MDSGRPLGLFRERKVLMNSTQAVGWSSSVSSDLQTHSPSGSQTLLCANNFAFLHSYSVARTKACVAFIWEIK